jgi:hypothetical protein
MADFGFPETITYRAMNGAVKTRKLPNGSFQAVAAFWFEGKRQNQVYFEAPTRARASGAGYRWLHR